MNSELAELKGTAYATFALARLTFATLIQKGVITDDEADYLLNGALTTLENILSANDPAAQPARELFDVLLQETVAARKQK